MHHLTSLIFPLLLAVAALGQKPLVLTTGVGSFLSSRPINTDEAIEQGWVKTDDPCDPSLGEEWRYDGVLSIDQSASMFFTPAVGSEAPGVLSAIAAHYYDHIPEDQVGTFFSFENFDADGNPYHSVVVVMYDTAEQSLLCDDINALPATTSEYFAVVSNNPEVPNRSIPVSEDDPELLETWAEGSCLNQMGFHWLSDVVPNSEEISFDQNSVLPIVPMYHPDTKAITGWFFWGGGKKQNWDTNVCPDPVPFNFANATTSAIIMECIAKINFWDLGPGLTEVNEPPFFFCSNSCDSKCSFQGSTDGTYTTMHWFLQDSTVITCPEAPFRIHCRNNFTHDQFDNLLQVVPEGTETVPEEILDLPEGSPLEESDSED